MRHELLAWRSMRNSFFDAIRRSLRPNAPLLLAAVEAAHPLAGVYAAWHDGPAAFADIVARSAPATALDPETDDHEDHMTALRLKLLPDGASSEEFSKRVNEAFNNHIPFLRRPFPRTMGRLESGSLRRCQTRWQQTVAGCSVIDCGTADAMDTPSLSSAYPLWRQVRGHL